VDQQQTGETEVGRVHHAAPEPTAAHPASTTEVAVIPPVAPTTGDWSVDLNATEVSEFLTALDKAVRARRLYAPNNPAYNSFLGTLKTSCKKLWENARSLSCVVDEHAFKWEDHVFVAGEGRDNLAFQFYKDGIRVLTFLPGFEDEIELLMDVLVRARQIDQSSVDDMVTLLWEQEFTALQYSYVDALAEGIEIPDTGPITFEKIDLTLVAEDNAAPVSSDPHRQPAAIEQGRPPVALTISRDDFNETLYFLEPKELDFLRVELEKEWRREVKRDVINALFDRLEDSQAKRQTEILGILRQLLPAYLSSGDLHSAAAILIELNGVRDILSDAQKAEAQEIFAELSDPAVLDQLLKSLEEGAIDPSGDELSVFLRHLRPEALAPLIRATETTRVPALQKRLRGAVATLGRAHPLMLTELLKFDDEVVVAGAVRMIGQIVLTAAVTNVAALLGHSAASVRRAAVEALVQIKSGAAVDALQKALDDPEREVRIAAVRGIGGLRYQPARARLEALLHGRIVRDADLTEKIAFFEAYGAVANAESVDMLDRLLNGKKLFAKQSPELRSCAAMALGKVGSAASRNALEQAADDGNPMVRNAVLKALRQEGKGA
jgi:HEAT repeat protein